MIFKKGVLLNFTLKKLCIKCKKIIYGWRLYLFITTEALQSQIVVK